jgi:hypothetical protein
MPVPARAGGNDDLDRSGTGAGGSADWTGSARIVHDDQGACFEINLA